MSQNLRSVFFTSSSPENVSQKQCGKKQDTKILSSEVPLNRPEPWDQMDNQTDPMSEQSLMAAYYLRTSFGGNLPAVQKAYKPKTKGRAPHVVAPPVKKHQSKSNYYKDDDVSSQSSIQSAYMGSESSVLTNASESSVSTFHSIDDSSHHGHWGSPSALFPAAKVVPPPHSTKQTKRSPPSCEIIDSDQKDYATPMAFRLKAAIADNDKAQVQRLGSDHFGSNRSTSTTYSITSGTTDSLDTGTPNFKRYSKSPSLDGTESESSATGRRSTKQFSKTQMCKYLVRGFCMQGPNCPFAHSQEELQHRPDLSCTKLCPKLFGSEGYCSNPSCTYAHSKDQLRASERFYKTKGCRFWEAGNCKLGDKCRFAHDDRRAMANDEGQDDIAPQCTAPEQDLLWKDETGNFSDAESEFDDTKNDMPSYQQHCSFDGTSEAFDNGAYDYDERGDNQHLSPKNLAESSELIVPLALQSWKKGKKVIASAPNGSGPVATVPTPTACMVPVQLIPLQVISTVIPVQNFSDNFVEYPRMSAADFEDSDAGDSHDELENLAQDSDEELENLHQEDAERGPPRRYGYNTSAKSPIVSEQSSNAQGRWVDVIDDDAVEGDIVDGVWKFPSPYE